MRKGFLVCLALAAPLGFLACGGGKPAANPGGDATGGASGASSASGPLASGSSTKTDASGIVEETWYEEASGKGGEKGSSVRTYNLDVTREEVVASPTSKDAGSKVVKFIRVQLKFPVPKVAPEGAREPHAINRSLWEARGEITKCFYGKKGAGPGGTFGAEMGLVAWASVNKKGEVTDAGIEKADESLTKAAGFTDCVMANVKGLSFGPAGDDVKIRFKFKLQTIDGAALPDFKPPKGS